MRIIFLNTWNAKVGEAFFDFIKSEAKKTDVFCLTETGPQLFSSLESLLPDYKGYIQLQGNKLDDTGYIPGQSIFVREGLGVSNLTKIVVYKTVFNDTAFLQFFDLKAKDKVIHMANIHGKAKPGTKKDTPIRIRQSQIIANYFKNKKDPIIFGGDFNLYPDTKSIKILEDAGYRNLIREFNIDSTRNRISWEQFDNIQHFADYVFVTKDVKVTNFEVPKNEISDHLPLIFDFEI